MAEHDAIPKDLPQVGPWKLILIGLVIVVVLGAGFTWRYRLVRQHDKELADRANEVASQAPVVEIVQPKAENNSQALSLPANADAYQETALYARVNGFLKSWYFDIGSHVQAGDLLAEISAPDLDAQLAQAQASLELAKANLVSANTSNELAQDTYIRYKGLVPSGSVTQQDLDTRQSNANTAKAALEAAKAGIKQAEANVQMLEAQQGFEKIYAPFTGTITTRNYDIGALISSTDTAVGHELFHIAETDKLRVWVYVPQSYVTLIRLGQPVSFLSSNYAGRKFTGYVARWSGALDPTTRTLRTELDFDNSDGLLWAGMYGEAQFNVQSYHPTLVVPSSALVFNSEGTQVAVLQDNKVHFHKITVGRDLGTEIEVASGLNGDERVVSNPGEQLVEGIEVQVVSASSAEKPPAAPTASATTRSGDQPLAQIDPPPSSSGGASK